MKLTDTLEKAFSDQVTVELEAATTYLQLAIELEALDLTGMASWMRIQSDEERAHADKFISHMLDRDSTPKIGAIGAPELDLHDALAAFKAALKHEQYVSDQIRGLVRTAEAAGDLDSRPLLDWFLSEQLEEEATVSEIIGRLEIIGDDGSGLLTIDSELGSRSQEPPSSIS